MVLAALVGAPLGASIGILVRSLCDGMHPLQDRCDPFFPFSTFNTIFKPNSCVHEAATDAPCTALSSNSTPCCNTYTILRPLSVPLQAGSFIIGKFISRPASPYLLRCDRSADDNPDIPMPDTANQPVSFWEKTLLKDTSPALIQPDYERVSLHANLLL